MRRAAAATDPVGDLFQVLSGARYQDHLAAGIGDLLRRRFADARRSARDEGDRAVDGVVQCAALYRVEQITQVEGSVTARRVRSVDEGGHSGERLLDQTGQITQIHSFHAPGGDSPGISTESAIPLSSSGASSAIRLLRRVIPRWWASNGR